MGKNRLLDVNKSFFVGCNYWASHAGTRMWSDWNPAQVETDLQRLSEAGIDVLRVFPLWPDFQPIESLYSGRGKHRGYRFGEERLPDDEAGRAGMSQVMMERFKQFTMIAEKYSLKIIVGLITGWMSGRLFVPPALRGKPILTDPDSIRWQIRFVRYFISEMKHSDTIVAWDLGNECNEMGSVSGREEAYVWTAAIANTIKASDSTRPLISGMHSLTPSGAWTMQDQGELTDILTTHPYPFWTPYMDYDPLDTIRPAVHAAAESLFYGQIGEKPCFAEEMGTMGPMVCSEEVAAAFARTSMLTQWSHGLSGLLWWCANDQTKLNHAPYDWVACEGELGLLTENGRVKPVLRELASLKNKLEELIPAGLPPRAVDGVCILNSSQDHWAAALGAFLLSKQAGFDIDFRYEEQSLPEADFYLLPSVTGVEGVPKQRWEELLRKVSEGATLYLSSNNGYMLNFSELTGLTVENRMRRASAADFVLGGNEGNTNLTVPSEFKLQFRNDRATILAAEPDGNPVLSRAAYGKGTVYFCSVPVELAMVQQPNVSFNTETMPYWRLYRTISEGVRSRRAITSTDPRLGITEHPSDDETRYAVVINYSSEASEAALTLQEGWHLQGSLYGDAAAGTNSVSCKLAPNDGSVLKLVRR
ncbi:glycoside hydrolase 5 family protein [Paenibacillus gansuensis]|uniref:Beta-mannanase n=1 Tax=Paenibacillus gansuensis TaxID=306542 RepID=A0ABW5P6G9_9BACL